MSNTRGNIVRVDQDEVARRGYKGPWIVYRDEWDNNPESFTSREQARKHLKFINTIKSEKVA